VNYPQTIAEYWQMHGYSKREADAMQRQQIREAMETADREDLYDAGYWNVET